MAWSLERTYDYYNRKYFGNELPKIPVQWSEVISDYAVYEQPSDDSDGLIRISSETRKFNSVWRMSLLHEMCHVKLREYPEEIAAKSRTPRSHSNIWQKEMMRLAQAGAFKTLW